MTGPLQDTVTRPRADGVRGGRELKLAGYEVFRFGAAELQHPRSAEPMLRQFFVDQFQQFGVTPRARELILDEDDRLSPRTSPGD